MEQSQLILQLFRTEFRKIVAVITRLFGLQHMEIAEDITSETFLLAAETWGKKGLPENPTAWLYTVAKNKTKDYLKRNQLFQEKISVQYTHQSEKHAQLDVDTSNEGIRDSELRMMFAICHPVLSAESQIGLALRILFGFGIDEIAEAFLTQKDTIHKRLHRAKEKWREENISMEMPPQKDIPNRLSAVHRMIYLLFNEGYYSLSPNEVLRKEMCVQAIQLALMLAENKPTQTPELYALLALMCFHASRLESRLKDDALVLMEEQNPLDWNWELIQRGEQYMALSAQGNEVSKYHLEAAIAYWHTRPLDHPDKWLSILKYYNLLLQVEYSPMAALNRTFALFKNYGVEKALPEAQKLQLEHHHLFHALLGEMYQLSKPDLSLFHWKKALELAKSPKERQLIEKKIEKLKG